MTEQEREIWEFIQAFNRAFAANDPDTYFQYIADEIVVITPKNPYRVEGLAADRREFTFGIESGASYVQFFQELQPLIRIYGDTAVVTYFSRGVYGKNEGRTAFLKETDVLVKRDGQWKIVHIHLSATV